MFKSKRKIINSSIVGINIWDHCWVVIWTNEVWVCLTVLTHHFKLFLLVRLLDYIGFFYHWFSDFVGLICIVCKILKFKILSLWLEKLFFVGNSCQKFIKHLHKSIPRWSHKRCSKSFLSCASQFSRLLHTVGPWTHSAYNFNIGG